MEAPSLKTERQQRGWSQTKLAKTLGVSTATVRRWEQGQAVPYPYYRKKLTDLFGKTAEELGLLSDADKEVEALSTAVRSEMAAETCLMTDLTIVEAMDHAQSLLEGNELEQYPSTVSLWNGDLDFTKRRSTFGALRQFPWRPFLMISVLSLAILIIVSVMSAFHQQPASRTSDGQDNSSPLSYTLTISTVDPSLQDTAQHLQQAFYAVYPQLVNRFAHDSATAARHVTLTFASGLSSPASIRGTTIVLNVDWMRGHPTEIGILTYELTLLVETYPSGSPDWLSSGIADYARSVYGPADDDWSLPDAVHPHDSYRQGGQTTARFLRWLELHTKPDIVDQLNHALQEGRSFSDVLRSLTHTTVDHLWSQYQTQSDITPTPEQRYKLATSRKPLFQGSYHLTSLKPDDDPYAFAPGFYLSNFALQADITVFHGIYMKGGFFVRNTGPDRYNIYIDTNGICELYWVNQFHYYASQSLPNPFNLAIKVGLNQTNRLTVIVEKSSIYIYINGQFITKVDDSRLGSYGTLGVMSLGDTGDIQFEKVQVF